MGDRDAIAIVGYAYRAPGVGRKGLWEYLADARSAWSDVPRDRFDGSAYYDANPEKPGCYASRGGHFLPDDVFAFDAAFFQIRADEARSMDPQHRLILECAFEAAESAGITLSDLSGSHTGVFAANEKSEYWQQTLDDLPTTSKYTATSTAACMFANRVSYFFNLHGPSVSIDAACASGSSAIHLGCQSLRSGECNTALIATASLVLNSTMWSAFDTMGALSPDGKCFSYDPRGSGFGRGEGAGCLVIKRLSEAIRDGDPIRAIIRNTAANHGGRTDGITVPSRAAQEELLRQVHGQVGLDPATTPVVEGHGTGTKVGDPIEANSIATVVGRESSLLNPIYLGSVKSNFGHTESTSGMLAVIKAVMMLENDLILPNASATTGGLNARIEYPERLKIVKELTPWPTGRDKRIVVSNFGFGGSNAAVLIESGENFSPRPTTTASNQERLFVFSAKTETALKSYLGTLSSYLSEGHGSSANDLAYTLCQRRTHHNNRSAVTAVSLEDLRHKLESGLTVRKTGKLQPDQVLFVFTGQGAQHARMGRALQRYPIFSQAIEQADSFLKSIGATWSLAAELEEPDDTSRINEPELSQPCCTAIQLAIVQLLRSWNVVPCMVTGHSSGEIAAAYAAGFVSFESALAIAYFRGQAASNLLQSSATPGGMLALGASAEQAQALIDESGPGYVTVAANNSPGSVTLSGDRDKIDQIEAIAQQQSLFARKLKISVAYHSRHMEQVGAYYLAAIKDFCKPDCGQSLDHSVVFVSSVTGEVETKHSINASYWVNNLLQRVQFLPALSKIYSPEHGLDYPNIIVEIGPHSALKGPIQQTLDTVGGGQQAAVQYFPSLVRGSDADKSLLELAGNLFTLGAILDFPSINDTSHEAGRVLVDLPPYEWDKHVSYKHESRITKSKAHPGHAYDSFLGWKSPYSEGNEHSFRQVFSLDELPWLRDHNIASDVIFPMTAYIQLVVAALEAINGKGTFGIASLRDTFAKSSLKIVEEERVDITTKLRPEVTGSGTVSSTAWAFEILSWSESRGWTLHAQGHLDVATNAMQIEGPAVDAARIFFHSTELKEGNASAEYGQFEAKGLCYGPTFRKMSKVWQCKQSHVLVHEIDLGTQSGSSLSSLEVAQTLAPLLDSFFHTMGAVQGMGGPRSTFVLTDFRGLRLLRTAEVGRTTTLRVVTNRVGHDDKLGSFTVNIVAFAQVDDSWLPMCEFEQLTGRSIATADSLSSLRLPDSYRTELVPYLDFMQPSELTKTIVAPSIEDSELSHRRELNEAASYFIKRALKDTTADDLTKSPTHLVKFRAWTDSTAKYIREDATEKSFEALISRVSSADAQGAMLCAVGEQLVPILRGEKEPLEVMLENNLLSRNYEEDVAGKRSAASLAKLVRLISDVKPGMRILEIGGGTASATVPVLEALSHGGQPVLIESYTFTDLSTGFFDSARVKLEPWSSYLEYRKLDISQDPQAQGFTGGSYDMIIASNVLHATPDMSRTISNVHYLLKPGGKLVMLECRSHAPLILPFALLPDWWLAEDKYRSDQGPMLTENSWNNLLLDTGFNGVDLAVADYPGTPEQFMNVLCATKVHDNACKKTSMSFTVYEAATSSEEQAFADQVAANIADNLQCDAVVKRFSEFTARDDSVCVFIDSPRSILSNVTPETFEILKKLFLDPESVIWVIPANAQPDCYIAKGLFRSLRHEDSTKNFFLIQDVPQTAAGRQVIATVAQHLRRHTHHPDQEFVWSSGTIHVPRLRTITSAKATFAQEAGVPARALQPISSSQDALEMTVETVGSPDSIYFHRTAAGDSAHLSENEVIIKVAAAGLNFRDLLLVLGSMPWHAPGLEGAGIVTHVGSAVTDLRAGDRVFYISNMNGLATHVKIPAVCAYRIPDKLSLVDASTMPIAYATALISLVQVGRLQAGETVLIHAASGAVGQAAIAIARNLGADIFVTAGTPEKREFLKETFGLPEDRIFSSRNADFRSAILRLTRGNGVDVILNSLSGDLLQATWDLIADSGRFVEIGKKDLLQNSYLGMRQFDRNVTFSGVDLHKIFKRRPEAAAEHLAEIVALYESGKITAIRPTTQVPISEVATGLRRLQTGHNIGKVVITMDPENEVFADLPNPLGKPTDHVLRPDATYVVTGGTGGIGRSLAPWLFENGAKYVVLLGRSGSSSREVASLLKQYEGSGYHLRAIACDVGSRADLERALCTLDGIPPVRGVVHGALYLRDSLFGNATFEDWQKVTAPKVQAAWSLHELLPGLDFFISLASVTGVTGHAGQSIYGGTTTFLDAFTAYRHSLGLPATSISLPVIEDVGYVADRGLSASLQRTLGVSLTVSQVKTLIKGAIIGSSSGLFADGKTMACVRGSEADVPWDRFHMFAALNLKGSSRNTSNETKVAQGVGDETSGDNLLDALMRKVCSLTMMDEDEVTPEGPLKDYGLDSLVSVELRNWIRREAGVELAMTQILTAANLQHLTDQILSAKGGAA